MSTSIQLKVDGMTCGGCVRSVEKKLSTVSGVSTAAVDLAAGKATVQYDEAKARPEDLIAAIEQIGFKAVRA